MSLQLQVALVQISCYCIIFTVNGSVIYFMQSITLYLATQPISLLSEPNFLFPSSVELIRQAVQRQTLLGNLLNLNQKLQRHLDEVATDAAEPFLQLLHATREFLANDVSVRDLAIVVVVVLLLVLLGTGDGEVL